MRMETNSHHKSLKSIAKGTGIVFLGMFIGRATEFITRLLVARNLGPDFFGLLTLAMSIFWIVTNLSVLGFGYGIIRYVAYYNGRKNLDKINNIIVSALKIVMPISLLFFLLFLFFSNQISSFFSKPELSPILQILSFAIPSYAFAIILFSVMKGFQKMKFKVLSEELFRNFSTITLIAISFSLGYELLGTSFSYLLGFFGTTVLSFYIVKKKIMPKLNFLDKSAISRELLLFTIPMSLTTITSLVIRWADTLFLGYFATTSAVGIYNSALLIVSLIVVFEESFKQVFIPALTDIYSRNKLNDLKKIYKTSTRWIFLIIIPILLMMLFFPLQIISLFFGKKYIEATIPLMILSIGYAFNTLFSLSIYVIICIGKTKKIFLISFIASIVDIILNILLIPMLGIIGSAISTSTSLAIVSLISLAYTCKCIKTQPFDFRYIKLFSASILAILLIYGLVSLFNAEIGRFDIILIFPAFVLLYIFLLIVMRGLSEEDIMILKAIEKKMGIKIPFLDNIAKRFVYNSK